MFDFSVKAKYTERNHFALALVKESKMMGTFLSRTLIMVLGYAYPAYECFKEVEKSMPETEQLLFWCHYWILVASFTFFERIGDSLISWLPMYSEAKLAFLIYLWHPKTKGTGWVYNSSVRPFLAKHVIEIDRNLSELKDKFGRYALVCWQMASSYGQSKFFEILEYVSSQSSSQQVATNQEDQVVRDEDGSHKIGGTTRQDQSPEADSELESETKQTLNENRKSGLEQQEQAFKESMQKIPGLWRFFRTKGLMMIDKLYVPTSVWWSGIPPRLAPCEAGSSLGDAPHEGAPVPLGESPE